MTILRERVSPIAFALECRLTAGPGDVVELEEPKTGRQTAKTPAEKRPRA